MPGQADTSAKEILKVIDDTLKSAQSRSALAAPASEREPAVANAEPPDVRGDFLKGAPQSIIALQESFKKLPKAEPESAIGPLIEEFYRKVHAFATAAALAETGSLAHIASALEALVKEFQEKPKNINASTVRTIGQTLDLLGTPVIFVTTLNSFESRVRSAKSGKRQRTAASQDAVARMLYPNQYETEPDRA